MEKAEDGAREMLGIWERKMEETRWYGRKKDERRRTWIG